MDRKGIERPRYSPGNIDFSSQGGAESGALGAQSSAVESASAALVGTLAEAHKAQGGGLLADPDLARLVQVWPLLPGDTQDVILAIVNGWLMEASEAQATQEVTHG